MPNGKIHYRNWYYAAPIAFIGGGAVFYLTGGDLIVSMCVPLGYFLGRWIDPDLDQVGITNAEGRMMGELKIFGAITTAWFLPYAYIMRFVAIGRKGHRNFFSHFPGVGTVIRLVWMFWAIALVFWWYRWDYTYPLHILLGIFVGLTLADGVHYIADVLE